MAKANAYPVRKRDGDGLMIDQRRLLQAIPHYGDPKEACEAEGISWTRFSSWLSKDEAFQQAFNDCFGSPVETVKALFESSALKAWTVYDDALDATHTVKQHVTCPNEQDVTCPCGCAETFTVLCNHTFPVEFETSNEAIRLRAGETVLKTAKVLVERKEVTQTNIRLSLEEMVALTRLKSGRSIPPHLETKFRQMGLIKDWPRQPDDDDNTIEGKVVER